MNPNVSVKRRRLFQEFLAAKDLMGTPHHTRVLRALEAYLYGNDWWKDVLKFYIGLASGPQTVAGWLASQIIYFKSMNRSEFSVQRANEILGSVIESFPEYSIEALAEMVRGNLDHSTTLSYLKQVQQNIT
jgi:hypothetical protein